MVIFESKDRDTNAKYDEKTKRVLRFIYTEKLNGQADVIVITGHQQGWISL